MARRALLIAYHFPPIQGSSGVLRTLSFTRHLPEFGWEPLVLTVKPRAYPRTNEHQTADIPEGLIVKRTFALDTARHLAIRGAHLRALAAPDRWWTWWLSGVPAGLRLIRRWGPEVIWSTAPIATAHLIGLTLHRMTGLPWVADIRDLLTEPNEPEDRVAWWAARWIERRTIQKNTRTVVVSPGQRDEYLNQFPQVPGAQIEVIPNGFEESDFIDAQRLAPPERPGNKFLLLHSGVLYPDGRNPKAFFRALAQLIQEGRIGSEELEVRLRASGSEKLYRNMIQGLGLESIVRLVAGLDYREGLAEMLIADGLLLFQGAVTNTAIPAKLYEYFRAQRPILALTELEGATAATLSEAGFTRIAPLESADAIAPVLNAFVQDLRQGQGYTLAQEQTHRYSRQHSCSQLAALFNEVNAKKHDKRKSPQGTAT